MRSFGMILIDYLKREGKKPYTGRKPAETIQRDIS